MYKEMMIVGSTNDTKEYREKFKLPLTKELVYYLNNGATYTKHKVVSMKATCFYKKWIEIDVYLDDFVFPFSTHVDFFSEMQTPEFERKLRLDI